MEAGMPPWRTLLALRGLRLRNAKSALGAGMRPIRQTPRPDPRIRRLHHQRQVVDRGVRANLRGDRIIQSRMQRACDTVDGREDMLDATIGTIKFMERLTHGLIILADADSGPLFNFSILDSTGIECDTADQWLERLAPIRLEAFTLANDQQFDASLDNYVGSVQGTPRT